MIYFKIVDPESKAWQITEEFNNKLQAEREEINSIPEKAGLPDLKVLSTRFGPVCFKPVEGMEIPEGLRLSKSGVSKGNWAPDRKTTRGKEIAKLMNDISMVKTSDYTKELFGTSASAMSKSSGGGFSMITGVGYKSWPSEKVALLNAKPELWEALTGQEGYEYPDGLVEITGTQYHNIKDELDAKTS